VVDDEEQIARLLAGALRSAGHQTEYVTDGSAALERLQSSRFDLLLTDLRMPGMDGMRLIDEAKRLDPEVDAVIMTAFASADTAVSALRSRIADYVPKPFSVEDIRRAVEKAAMMRDERRRRDQERKNLSEKVETTQETLRRRVSDLGFLHDMTRLIAGNGLSLRGCVERIAAHLEAEALLFVEEGDVVESDGFRDERKALELARGVARAGQLRSAPENGFACIAAPAGRGAVVVRRMRPFSEEEIRLLSIAGRDLALAVENERLRGDRRKSYVGIVATLIEAVEAKDRFNRGHSRRVAQLAVRFAHQLGMSAAEVDTLEVGAKLHDIGKIGIPEEILNKPDKLTPDEFQVMQTHPALGEQMLLPLDILAEIRPIVRHHHERWDGRGYPDGLRAKDIPRGAALLAVCDSYDAMTSTRPYREGLSPEAARAILLRGAGEQWDPELVSAFSRLWA
jgi:putative nucleotidyltransferase with HDIG domain